jgi:hypothetical protein
MHITNSTTMPSIQLASPSRTSLAAAEQALARIKSRPNGNALLNEIDSHSTNGKQLKIFVAPHGGRMANVTRAVDDINNPGQDNFQAVKNASKGLFGKGKGASAEIDFNPSTSLALDHNGNPTGIEQSPNRAYLSLAHELVHAYRIMKGTYTGGGGDMGFDPNSNSGKEELRAVGLGKWQGESLSENGIRGEQGEQLRNAYPARPAARSRDEFDPTARFYGGDA